MEELNMNYIVYHRADFDGYFSALVTASALIARKEQDNNVQKRKVSFQNDFYFIGYNYEKDIYYNKKDNIIFDKNVLEKDDEIYFVDCFKRDIEYLKEIADACNSIYIIDHHETTSVFFEEFKKEIPLNISTMGVINSSEKDGNGNLKYPYSAVIAAWIYFGYGSNIPELIKYISNYDIWNKNNKDGMDWNKDILPFQFGLRAQNYKLDNIYKESRSFGLIDYFVTEMIMTKTATPVENECPICIENIISDGKAILSYIKMRNERVCSFGKKCTLRINDKTWSNCYFVTDYMNSSMIFEHGLQDYQEYDYLVILGPRLEDHGCDTHGSVFCNVQIITANERGNCSELCNMLGGGGHKQIGGCQAFADIYGPYENGELILELIDKTKYNK